MNNMRRGFTMIELIFVIVIIGILAAVAIPKLTANRDEAVAKICENDVGILITELVSYYSTNGYFDKIENMTGLEVGVGTNATNHGVKEAKGTILTVGTSLNYVCAGEVVMTITPTASTYNDTTNGKTHNQFGLVTVKPTTNPTRTPGLIFVTDMDDKHQYKASPGFVISGN